MRQKQCLLKNLLIKLYQKRPCVNILLTGVLVKVTHETDRRPLP